MSRLAARPAVAAVLLAALLSAALLAACSTPEGLELVVHNRSGRPALVAIHEGIGAEDEVMELLIVGQQTVPPGAEEHFHLPSPSEWTLSIDGHLVYDSTGSAAATGGLQIEVGSGGRHEVKALPPDRDIPSRWPSDGRSIRTAPRVVREVSARQEGTRRAREVVATARPTTADRARTRPILGGLPFGHGQIIVD